MKRTIYALTFTFLFYTFQAFGMQVNLTQNKELNIVIKSSYKRNKKIWGTYKQYREKTSAYDRSTKKEFIKSSSPIGTLLLQNGKLVLINPVSSSNGQTELKLKTFPYKYDRKRKKYSIKKDLLSNQNLIDLYHDRLISILDEHPTIINHYDRLDEQKIHFGNVNCKSRKAYIHCELPVKISVDVIEATTHF